MYLKQWFIVRLGGIINQALSIIAYENTALRCNVTWAILKNFQNCIDCCYNRLKIITAKSFILYSVGKFSFEFADATVDCHSKNHKEIPTHKKFNPPRIIHILWCDHLWLVLCVITCTVLECRIKILVN